MKYREINPNKPDFPSREDLIRILERFPLYAEKSWQILDMEKKLGLFGKLTPVTEMRVRPHVNALLAYALLYKSPYYDPVIGKLGKEELLSRIILGMNYITETHISNERVPLPEHIWGDDWQSAWWTTQIAIVLFLMRDVLPQDLIKKAERVIEFEANRFIDLEPPSGLIEDTKCEENAWDCTILAWARNIMPDHPNSMKWEMAGKIFAINSFSTFDDHFNNSWLDGKRVRDWVSTHNVFPDFTVENHGSFHPAYLATFSLLCYAHSAYLLNNREAPPQFQFNVMECYNVWKRFILWGGRVAYPCGNDWPNLRVPSPFVFAFLSRVYNDPLAKILYKWSIIRLDELQRISQDGSFYGGFLLPDYEGRAQGRRFEFECDVASSIAMSYLINPEVEEIIDAEKIVRETGLGVYNYKYSEFLVAKTPYMFASFSWRSLSHRPLGLVIPYPKEDFGGWIDENLTGDLIFRDAENKVQVEFHNDYLLNNGFITCGVVKRGLRKQEWLSNQYLLFAALPDMRTCVLHDHVIANADGEISLNMGLGYHIENDLLNGNKRTLSSAEGEVEVQGFGGRSQIIPIKSPYLKIDNAITIYSYPAEMIYVDSSVRNDNFWRSFTIDAIYVPFSSVKIAKGDVIRDCTAALICGGDSGNPILEHGIKNNVLNLLVKGTDNKMYLIVSNLSRESVTHMVKWKDYEKTFHLKPYALKIETI